MVEPAVNCIVQKQKGQGIIITYVFGNTESLKQVWYKYFQRFNSKTEEGVESVETNVIDRSADFYRKMLVYFQR